MKWDEYFFNIAREVSGKSKDPSSKFGSVITSKDHRIMSVGFNGFSRGVKDYPRRYNNRELKYKLIVHSEENAIF